MPILSPLEGMHELESESPRMCIGDKCVYRQMQISDRNPAGRQVVISHELASLSIHIYAFCFPVIHIQNLVLQTSCRKNSIYNMPYN